MPNEIVPPEDLNDIVDPAPIDPALEEDDDADLDPEVDPAPPEDETPEQLKARLAASEDARRKLYARLQREKNKSNPTPPQTPATPPQPAQPTSLTREEGILFSKGFSEDEVEYAKKVAALEGVKLTEAVTNKLFTGWKAERDTQAKRLDAQLPASRGGRTVKKITLDTPGLSDDDHKALAEEEMK